jgi:hypothetical protein
LDKSQNRLILMSVSRVLLSTMTLVPSSVSSWMVMTGKQPGRAAVAAAKIMPQMIVSQIDKHGVFFLRNWISFSSLLLILCFEEAT